MDRLLIFNTPNNNGTVKGAISDVMIAILIESAVFPFTISVNVGDATPAGMAVRRRMPTASPGLNRFVKKKNRTGIISMLIMIIYIINLTSLVSSRIWVRLVFRKTKKSMIINIGFSNDINISLNTGYHKPIRIPASKNTQKYLSMN